ncbi:MAG: VOC family protein [Granulosicoccus sp.]
MLTDALQLAGQAANSNQSERLSWGVMEFQVIDLDRTVAFWTSALGLRVRDQDSSWVALGTRTQTMFVFRDGASVPVTAGYSGMYHVAIGVPDQHEFSRLLSRLMAMRVSVSPVDHLMSKAIYLNDPDGLEIEIAFETPERFGRFGDMSRGLVLYDAHGAAHSGRERLDVESELAHASDADLMAPLSDSAFLAHLHFKVPDLESTAAWFERIGFARNLMLPGFGFADMGAGAAYTHRLAMNVWTGKDLSPTPDTMARLTHYELNIHDYSVITDTHGLQPSETGFKGRDPTGIDLSLNVNHLDTDGASQ